MKKSNLVAVLLVVVMVFSVSPAFAEASSETLNVAENVGQLIGTVIDEFFHTGGVADDACGEVAKWVVNWWFE